MGGGASESGSSCRPVRRHTVATISGNRSTGGSFSRQGIQCERGADPISARHQFRFLHGRLQQGDTIALIGKFKPAKGKPKGTRAPQGGLPCVILVIIGMFLVMGFLFLVMKSSSNS